MIKKILFALLIYTGGHSTLCAQSITNVVAKQDGQQIIIEYELSDLSKDEAGNVSIFYTKDFEHFIKIEKGLSGDINKEISSNGKKNINWNVLGTAEAFKGEYAFRIDVKIAKRTTKKGVRSKIDSVRRKGNSLFLDMTITSSENTQIIFVSSQKNLHNIQDINGRKYYIKNATSSTGFVIYGGSVSGFQLKKEVDYKITLQILGVPNTIDMIKTVELFDKNMQNIILIKNIQI